MHNPKPEYAVVKVTIEFPEQQISKPEIWVPSFFNKEPRPENPEERLPRPYETR